MCVCYQWLKWLKWSSMHAVHSFNQAQIRYSYDGIFTIRLLIVLRRYSHLNICFVFVQ